MPDTGELKERVARALAAEVAPALDMDASRLEVVEVVDGIARIRVSLGCASCPSHAMTVLMGIEQELRKRVPEIDYLEAVI